MAKNLCEQKGLEYQYKMLNEDYTPPEFFDLFPGARTFPQIVVDGKHVGGFNELKESL
jgi:glutaredoxin 3